MLTLPGIVSGTAGLMALICAAVATAIIMTIYYKTKRKKNAVRVIEGMFSGCHTHPILMMSFYS